MYRSAHRLGTLAATGHGMPPVTWTLTAVLLLVVSAVVADNCTSGQPPIITIGPPPHRAYNDANPIKLVCQAQGSHPIRFLWYKNGVRLGDSKEYMMADGKLNIRRASADTEGEYQCMATNGCGTAFSNITWLQRMFIEKKHSGRSAVRSQNNSVGNKLTIQCDKSAISGTAKTTIYWAKLPESEVKCRGQGERVKQQARVNMDANGSLAFGNLLPGDAGLYKCFVQGSNARHGAGCVHLQVDPNPHQHNLVPQLMYHSRSPQTGFQGEDFHLRCFFSGRPTPNVTFTKETGHLPYGRSVIDDVTHELTIKHTTLEDAGYYVCRGQNEAGQSETVRIEVNVYARPLIVEGPRSVNTSQGMRVVFKCKGKGTPQPQVMWFKNTLELTGETMQKTMSLSSDESELEISTTRVSDQGTYHCNLSNPYGYVLSAAYLAVNENYAKNEIHVVKEMHGQNGEDSSEGEKSQPLTTSTIGYVMGAIVVAIIIIVFIALLIRKKRNKSDSYNLGSPESCRLDTLRGDHTVGHRLLDEPQSTVTRV